MTEKRYTLEYGEKVEFWDNHCDLADSYLTYEDVVNRLNELNDDVEILKKRLRIYKDDGLENLKDLEKAYENNKKALENIEKFQDEIEKLKKENKELKQQLILAKPLYSRRELERENKELKRENDILIKQRLGEERLKQEIADYHTSNGRLHRLNNDLIRRLDKFDINYLDILEEFND